MVCEQPCHPGGVFHEGYGRSPLVREDDDGIAMRRLWVAASPRKSTPRRLAFYGTFAAGAAAVSTGVSRPDVALLSTPPLPGVLSAAAALAARRVPLVVDVRDLWPAAAEALGELSQPNLVRAFERAERWLYRRAARVTATTRPFCAHIDRVADRTISVHLPNGALDELVELPYSPPPPQLPFVVGYVGNMGIAQGLSIVLDGAARLKDAPVRFRLVGDGPVRRELDRAAERLSNVEVLPPVPVERLGPLLQGCHALLVPLRAHPLLADFLPSKLYDAMAVGRPAIVAAEGEAANLALETGAGIVVPPEDGASLANAIRALLADPARAARIGAAGRAAVAGFARSRQLGRLESVLEQAARRFPAR